MNKEWVLFKDDKGNQHKALIICDLIKGYIETHEPDF